MPASISPMTAGCFSLSKICPKILANIRARAINNITSSSVGINLLRLLLPLDGIEWHHNIS